jgi:sulfur relay protein TusB/DsrH
MTLHCIYSASALSSGSQARDVMNEGDGVLLLASAVVLAGSDIAIPAGVQIFALAEDLDAHGIVECSKQVTRVDYDGWVALTQHHCTQQVWA